MTIKASVPQRPPGDDVPEVPATPVVGNVVIESPAASAALVKSDLKAELAARQAEAIAGVQDFDWKHVPPPQLAQVLCRIPFKAGAGETDYYLQPWQALIFAMRCFELGLSPFSNEVWFNPKINKVNVTLEGKMKLARNQGYNFGPPRFEEKTVPWPKTIPAIAGRTEDVGIICRITVNGKETAEYTAWLSEWYVAHSPVWKAKTKHMLQVRALEKCISMASGTGSSEMPGEADVDGSAGIPPTALPAIEVVTPQVTHADVTDKVDQT